MTLLAWHFSLTKQNASWGVCTCVHTHVQTVFACWSPWLCSFGKLNFELKPHPSLPHRALWCHWPCSVTLLMEGDCRLQSPTSQWNLHNHISLLISVIWSGNTQGLVSGGEKGVWLGSLNIPISFQVHGNLDSCPEMCVTPEIWGYDLASSFPSSRLPTGHANCVGTLKWRMVWRSPEINSKFLVL